MQQIDIERFIEAQNLRGSYDTALEEVRRGHKYTHWIWYVFPQMKGLGYSGMSKRYGITSLFEAKAYLANDTLNRRLHEISEALLGHAGATIEDILGSIDAMKVRSCMTLFDIVAPHDIFQTVLDIFYDGERCQKTLNLLKVDNYPQIPDYLKIKTYGQTRTLVDMLIELNKKNHYNSPEQALQDLYRHLEHIRIDGDDVAFNCSVRNFGSSMMTCFENGVLNITKLESILYHDFYTDIDKVYAKYVVEKSIKIIAYLNDFRRYNSYELLIKDFIAATGGVNHCGSNLADYYFSFGSPSGNYVFHYLNFYLSNFWNEFSTDGILDNHKFFDFMIGRHARGIRKYGLEAVIRRNYKSDSCHTEVYFPYRGGAAPVYVETKLYSDAGWHANKRIFVKSCGEGKGPNGIANLFEFERILPILDKDVKYQHIGRYYIPKKDYTLPVFDEWFGRILFETSEAQKLFIEKNKDYAGKSES